MAIPSDSDLADKLFAAADSRARQHGLQFGAGADVDLRGLARVGAETILKVAQSKPSDEGEQYVRGAARVAAEAMSTFVDEMTSARLRIAGYAAKNPNTIGEETFKQARKILCPIWPIC